MKKKCGDLTSQKNLKLAIIYLVFDIDRFEYEENKEQMKNTILTEIDYFEHLLNENYDSISDYSKLLNEQETASPTALPMDIDQKSENDIQDIFTQEQINTMIYDI
jgi:hypothetical protein